MEIPEAYQKHKKMIEGTAEKKVRNKLVKSKHGWMKFATGTLFLTASLSFMQISTNADLHTNEFSTTQTANQVVATMSAENSVNSETTTSVKNETPTSVSSEATNSVSSEATNSVSSEATNSVSSEATNSVSSEATNSVSSEATNSVSSEATNSVSSEATNSVSSEATNSVSSEATNSVSSEATNSVSSEATNSVSSEATNLVSSATSTSSSAATSLSTRITDSEDEVTADEVNNPIKSKPENQKLEPAKQVENPGDKQSKEAYDSKTVYDSNHDGVNPDTATNEQAGVEFSRYRQKYHYTDAQGGGNDVQTIWKDSNGLWHFYYLHSDTDQFGKDRISQQGWAHVTSSDLVHFQDCGTAVPAKADGLWDATWTGSIVTNENGFYKNLPKSPDVLIAAISAPRLNSKMGDTGQNIFLLDSLDGGYTFKPMENHPINGLPQQVDGYLGDNRDPNLWYNSETNQMELWLAQDSDHGNEHGITQFVSDDGFNFKYIGKTTLSGDNAAFKKWSLVETPAVSRMKDQTTGETKDVMFFGIQNWAEGPYYKVINGEGCVWLIGHIDEKGLFIPDDAVQDPNDPTNYIITDNSKMNRSDYGADYYGGNSQFNNDPLGNPVNGVVQNSWLGNWQYSDQEVKDGNVIALNGVASFRQVYLDNGVVKARWISLDGTEWDDNLSIEKNRVEAQDNLATVGKEQTIAQNYNFKIEGTVKPDFEALFNFVENDGSQHIRLYRDGNEIKILNWRDGGSFVNKASNWYTLPYNASLGDREITKMNVRTDTQSIEIEFPETGQLFSFLRYTLDTKQDVTVRVAGANSVVNVKSDNFKGNDNLETITTVKYYEDNTNNLVGKAEFHNKYKDTINTTAGIPDGYRYFSGTQNYLVQRDSKQQVVIHVKKLGDETLPSSNGSDAAGSNGSNAVGSNGSNAAGSNGSNAAGSNGSNVAGSNGSNAAGSNGSNAAGSNGSDAAGSNGSNAAGSNGSNAAGSNGSNAAGSNGSDAAGSNGSDAAGSNGSNAAGSNGSNAAGSNGSNAAGSNGSDAAGSNGSDAAGSNGSDAAGSNGSDAAGSNGSSAAGSNGSNVAGSNGSDAAGSNGSDAAGSNGSDAAGSNGSDAAGSNGSDVAGSNGSDVAGSNGSKAAGSNGSNASGSNSSDAAGSNDSNAAGSNGSNAAGSNGSNASGSNSSDAAGSNGSNASGSNDSNPTRNNEKPATESSRNNRTNDSAAKPANMVIADLGNDRGQKELNGDDATLINSTNNSDQNSNAINANSNGYPTINESGMGITMTNNAGNGDNANNTANVAETSATATNETQQPEDNAENNQSDKNKTKKHNTHHSKGDVKSTKKNNHKKESSSLDKFLAALVTALVSLIAFFIYKKKN
ncbi:hypothetical protein R4B61_02755 [Fructilactobacillus vespulae]|uniref:hypothetical protein n=1 Tax=Fructilactobacillus vespulae TaxID=1249630 RepID=UPI0039B59331